jgi:hypothetical protein
MKKKLQVKRKFLQSTYPQKNWYVAYVKKVQYSTVKQINNPTRKWAEDMKRYFIEEVIQAAKNMKIFSTSLTIEKSKIRPQCDTTIYPSEWQK